MATKPKSLSMADLNAVLAADSALSVAAHQISLADAKSRIAMLTHENEVLRSRMSHELNARLCTEEKTAAESAQKMAQQEQAVLAQRLTKVYGIKWSSACFNPLTGEISDSPQA